MNSFSSEIKKRIIKDIDLHNPHNLYCLNILLFSKSATYKSHYGFLIKYIMELAHYQNISVNFNVKNEPRAKKFYELELKTPLKTIYRWPQINAVVAAKNIFLFHGFVSNPNKQYQLGFSIKQRAEYDFISSFLYENNVNFKIFPRKTSFFIRITQKQAILRFFELLGTSYGILNLENLEIIRDYHNKANRSTNFATANLKKQARAAGVQIAAIKKLKRKGVFKKLNFELRTIASLRIMHPYKSLAELLVYFEGRLNRSMLSKKLNYLVKLAAKSK